MPPFPLAGQRSFSEAAAMVRIGILGAGAMGAVHAAAFAGMPGVEIAGVFSRNAEKARAVAAICNAKPSATTAALIEDPTIDAIDVCLPSAEHAAAAIPALDHGKHVFCETPMALELEEARALAAMARRADRLLQVGLLVRSIAT